MAIQEWPRARWGDRPRFWAALRRWPRWVTWPVLGVFVLAAFAVGLSNLLLLSEARYLDQPEERAVVAAVDTTLGPLPTGSDLGCKAKELVTFRVDQPREGLPGQFTQAVCAERYAAGQVVPVRRVPGDPDAVLLEPVGPESYVRGVAAFTAVGAFVVILTLAKDAVLHLVVTALVHPFARLARLVRSRRRRQGGRQDGRPRGIRSRG